MQATPSRSAALLMTLSLAPLAVAASEAPQTGQWQPHELEFTYVGFTSHYSCDGLADKLALLLKVAGARADAKAVGGGCDHVLGGPSRVAHARLNFHTLAPAAPAETPKPPPPAGRELGKPAPALKPAATAPEPGVGAWKSVDLHAGSPRDLAPGDCELVEQFARDVLPLFTTRKLESRITCVPHQLLGSSILLKFEVLAALPPAEKPAPQPR